MLQASATARQSMLRKLVPVCTSPAEPGAERISESEDILAWDLEHHRASRAQRTPGAGPTRSLSDRPRARGCMRPAHSMLTESRTVHQCVPNSGLLGYPSPSASPSPCPCYPVLGTACMRKGKVMLHHNPHVSWSPDCQLPRRPHHLLRRSLF